MTKMTVMKLTGITLLASVLWGSAAAAEQDTYRSRQLAQALLASEEGVPSGVQAPDPWIQEDPGARAYVAARDYLNARQYRDAAQAFYRLRRDYPASGYLADSVSHQRG